jgi:hypothetical protein
VLQCRLGDGVLEVGTDRPDPEWGVDVAPLRNLVPDPPTEPDRSEAALVVWRRTWRHRLAPQTRWITIDGRPEPFAFLEANGGWAARREHYGLAVTLHSEGVDPDAVDLRPVGEPAAPPRLVRTGRGEMPSPAEIGGLIDQHALSERREAILDALQAGYALMPGDGPVRIGGLPDLAEGEVWPHDDRGVPFTFIAQIETWRLPAVIGDFPAAQWGHSGELVRVFAALDARLAVPGPAVALGCPRDAPVGPMPLPPRPDPMPADAWEPADERNRQLVARSSIARPLLSAPIAWEVLGESDLGERYEELRVELAPPDVEWTTPRLLGFVETEQGEDPRSAGDWVHRDDPALAGSAPWQLLIDVPGSFEFGDGGSLAIVIPVADLASGRYDRLVAVPSMG